MDTECIQCGAKISPDKDDRFYSCPFCRSTLYIQEGRSLQHYYVPLKVVKKNLMSILSMWLAGNELHEDVTIVSTSLIYFPFWYFQFGGSENHLTPANSSEVEEINRIELPLVDLLPFSAKELGQSNLVEAQFLHDVSLEKVVTATNTSPDRLVSSSLIHLPLWTVAYTYGTDPAIYTVVVEGTGGAVYANVIPAAPLKQLRTAYLSLGYGSLALFIVAGLASPNVWWRIGSFAVLVPIVFLVGKVVVDKYG